MEISIFVRSETAPAFNFLFRVLSPVIYIIIVSAIFYKFELDFLVKNIYLVSIYYITFRLFFNIITDRHRLINWRRQIIHASTMSIISWLTYDSIIKNKKNVLPDFNTVSNELWIIILLFLFQVLNNLTFSSEDTEKRKENHLMARYSVFKAKFGGIITELSRNKKLEALIYAIIIYEDFNRPKVIRYVENMKFRATKKTMTLGIMQVQSNEIINDIDSIKRGVRKLLNDLKDVSIQIERTDEYREWEIQSALIEKFNGGKSYNSEVSELFQIVWSKFYNGDNNNSYFEDALKT